MKRILLFILPILIIVSAAFTIFEIAQVRFEEEKLIDDLKRKAKSLAESIEFSVRHVLETADLKNANRLVEKFEARERLQGCAAERELRGKGLTVFVGGQGDYSAEYYLNDTREVAKFLERIVELKKGPQPLFH